MVEFKTLKTKDFQFGRNSFIKVLKRKVITPTGENKFIAISRGFYQPDKTKRCRSSITLSSEKDKRKEIAKLI